MEREHISGTLLLWPGVAEELVGAKAYYVRDGHFKDVDACIFTHVNSNLSVKWGDTGYNGLVSVKFNFEGEAAQAAMNPWRGKSALDAVELMMSVGTINVNISPSRNARIMSSQTGVTSQM